MVEHFVNPLAEAAEIGGDTGSVECAAFEWRVTPGFVVRGIESQVVGGEQIIIGKVEDAIVTFEVARDEDDLHFVGGEVLQSDFPNLTHDAVLVEVPKFVSNDGIGKWCVVVFLMLCLKAFLQIGAGTLEPAGYFDQREYLTVVFGLFVELGAELCHGFEENVEALATVVVAAARRDNQSVVRKGATRQSSGYIEDAAAGFFANRGKLRPFRYEIVLEAVGQDNVGGLVEQLFALTVGKAAHSGEAVGAQGRLLLDAVFGIHV